MANGSPETEGPPQPDQNPPEGGTPNENEPKLRFGETLRQAREMIDDLSPEVRQGLNLAFRTSTGVENFDESFRKAVDDYDQLPEAYKARSEQEWQGRSPEELPTSRDEFAKILSSIVGFDSPYNPLEVINEGPVRREQVPPRRGGGRPEGVPAREDIKASTIYEDGKKELDRQMGTLPVDADEETKKRYHDRRANLATSVYKNLWDTYGQDLINRATMEGRATRAPTRTEVQLPVVSQYGEIRVNVENSREGVFKAMRDRLGEMETILESFGSQNNAGAMEAISLNIRALRDMGTEALRNPEMLARLREVLYEYNVRQGIEHDFSDEELRAQAREYLRWSEEMRNEFEARLYLHEFFLKFQTITDAEQFRELAPFLKGKYFDVYTKFEEVQDAFVLYDQHGEEFVLGREPSRAEFRKKVKQTLMRKRKLLDQKSKERKREGRNELKGGEEDTKFVRYGEGLMVVDENGNPVVDRKDIDNDPTLNIENLEFEGEELSLEEEREIDRQVAWAQNMAERMWRAMGRQTLFNRVRYKRGEDNPSEEKEFSADFFAGDFLLNRILRDYDWLETQESGLNVWRKLRKGVDLDNFDLILFYMEETKKRFWQEKVAQGLIPVEQRDANGNLLTEKQMIKMWSDPEWNKIAESKFGLKESERPKTAQFMAAAQLEPEDLKKRHQDEHGDGHDEKPKKSDPLKELGMEENEETEGKTGYQLRAQALRKYAHKMTPDAWRVIMRNSFSEMTDNMYGTWIHYQVASPDVVRKTGTEEGKGYFLNPNTDSFTELVTKLSYRGTNRMDEVEHFFENHVVYLAKDRPVHKPGDINANFDELETTLNRVVARGLLTYHKAEEAFDNAFAHHVHGNIPKDLVHAYLTYRKLIYLFDIWAALLGFLAEVGKESFDLEDVLRAGGGGGGGRGHGGGGH